MYRLYLLCIMSAVAFGDGDEAKYIDLLPEAEKQEFLNRIARRIIEEIQSKEPPEQSQAEVSDDQLNAHHEYVQDLIKQESKTLRHDRRNYDSEEKLEKKANDELDKIDGGDKNNEHIDLTLRNDKHIDNNKRKLSDETSFSVIPVKVVYDQADNESIKSPKNTELPELVTSNLEQKANVNRNSSFNNSKMESINASSLAHFTEGKEHNKVTKIQSTHVDSQEPEVKSDIIPNNGLNSSHQSMIKSTKIQASENTTVVEGLNEGNKNYDDSFEITKRSTEAYTSSNKNMDNKHKSPTERIVQLSNSHTTLMPLVTEMSTQKSSKKLMHSNAPSSTTYKTTVKSIKGNTNKKSDIDSVNVTHNVEEVEEIKTKKDLVRNVAKKHPRKRLEISEEYKFEKGSLRNNNKRQRNKNNNVKQYFVYEVPQEKSVFVQRKDKENKSPHVVPVYNFAPNNAYYNAYNRYGINNDEESKIKKKSHHKDVLDKELYLRSGFEIDLNLKNDNYRKDEMENNENMMNHPRHPHWAHILNAKFENKHPVYIDNDYDENIHKIKRNNEFKQLNRYDGKKKKLPKPPKIPNKIKYIPLRLLGENNMDDATRRKKEMKNYFEHNLLNSMERDNVKAVKAFLFQQKKFGLPNPITSLSKIQLGKRTLDVDRKYTKKPKPKTIDLDYYFGKYRTDNITREDSNEEYFDMVDMRSETDKLYDPYERDRKLDIQRYRVETHDDCEHGCIEMDLNTPGDSFNYYLETLVQILKDMIYRDNQDLVNYDWLLSTVNLQSAVKKLIDITDNIEKGNRIHKLDLKLLKYIVYLYNTSNDKLKNTIQSKTQSKAFHDIKYIVNSFLSLLRRRIALPRNKKRKPGDRIANPAEFWYKYYVRDGLEYNDVKSRNIQEFRRFQMFLRDLEDNMYELHNALKHIALITTYGNQNWYRDLKNIYLKAASKKKLLQVILHLVSSKLFGSLEETAKNVEEDELYIQKNGDVVRRIQEEFIFVLKILQKIKNTNK